MSGSSTLRRLVITVAVAVPCGAAAPAQAATYVPGCGSPGYLEVRPKTWSGGCTGGALNVSALRWSEYLSAKATARGRAELRHPCGVNPGCPEAGLYRAAARLRFFRTRTCSGGEADGERYYTRVRVRVRMRRGNPFGYRAGWKTYRVTIPEGEDYCSYAS